MSLGLKDLKARQENEAARTRRTLKPRVGGTSGIIQLERVRTDGGTQPRQSMDTGLVESYAERMRWDEGARAVVDPDGEVWPPVTVFEEGQTLWLADGFHRVHAARACGLPRFQARYEKGSLEDAILYSVGANATHGKRRTRADIKRAIERVLLHEEWGQRSNLWLAEICKVSDKTIANHRERLERAGEIPFHTELVSQNHSYNSRTPPAELDADGFLVTPSPEEANSTPARGPRPARASDASHMTFGELDALEAEAIVAFPITPRDCRALLEAITTTPELVVIPVNQDSSMVYEAPAALAPLVEERDMVGPRIVELEHDQRFYFIWGRADLPSGRIPDAASLLGGRTFILLGQPLGGWTRMKPDT